MPTNDVASISHLLRRTEYVARPNRVAALTGLGSLDAAIDDILNVSGTPVPIPPGLASNTTNSNYEQYVQATQWWFDRMVDSPKPIQEKMTFFWHGHFTSAWDKVNSSYMMMSQNKLYRDNALGNFVTLTQAMAIEPAMLVYLDNTENRKGAPNQNFARELMELFTLGIGNYSEADVEAAAKAWTGYGVDWTEARITHNWSLRLNTECTPIERHAVLYFIEQGLMSKTGKRFEWETGVRSGDPLMATIQDYDWADEVLHAAIGREWYIPQIGRWKEALEYGDQCWSKIVSNWASVRDQGLTEHANWWPRVYNQACEAWGVEPDPAVLAYAETYESQRADFKIVAASG